MADGRGGTAAIAPRRLDESPRGDRGSGGGEGEGVAVDEVPAKGVGVRAPGPVADSVADGELLPEVFSTVDWASAERLGFPPSPNVEVRAAEMAAVPLLRLSAQRCEKHWQSSSRGLPLLTNATTKVTEFMQQAVWHHGIPRHLRSVIWLTLSGVAAKMDENRGFCRALLKRHGYVRGEYAEAIEKDLHRTFPEHLYFAEDGVGLRKARNVLHALCWRNPLLNYCQSFNYLVALLLLVTDDEESTFWLMCHLLENLLPNDLYSETLIGTKVDQLVLQKLLRERLPRLARHFSAVHFEVGTLMSAWVMVLFINVFPVETVLRVWDCLFAGGSHACEPSCMPLEVVLAVLQLHQSDLLRCDDAGDVITCLGHAARRLFDADKLVRTSRAVRLLPWTLREMRRSARPAVVEDHHIREKRRQELLERCRLAEEEKMSRGGVRHLRGRESAQEFKAGTAAEGPQGMTAAPVSGHHRAASAPPPTEPHQREYRDYFAGTGFAEEIAVNAWHRLKEANCRLEKAWEGLGDEAEPSVAPASLVGPTRWCRKEDSAGHEMESLRARSRDQEGASAPSVHMCDVKGEHER
ncbi:putative GTPase activator protein [Trypanosoma conorhini]|uniref:Putative GTPase activator protein n=1 Tax=Trypanosoma conorhini TaxID=83891 RepID=A0A3R7NQ07_9TRYP|nr:putative GTPase activator protein [Trypanosoma conorhini]RNF21619.1 putative GTPase activator protein [Trypanosoma conorhini]